MAFDKLYERVRSEDVASFLVGDDTVRIALASESLCGTTRYLYHGVTDGHCVGSGQMVGYSGN